MRVIAPDVGGGFGGKNRLMPEDVAVAAIALKVGHPVRWIEDRREHLLASIHARDHYYDITLSADKDGTLLGIEGDIYIDAGAYALWPTGAFQEASMASRNLTGPYRIRHLNLKTYTVATNKAPMGPYRGVARPGACFAIERMVDEMARELDREPFDLRRQNIVTAAELPYDTAAGMRLDTGDYIKALDTARDMIDLPAVRKRQRAGEPDGRAVGVGFAFYTEQSGHGTAEFAKRKFRVIPGYESANARMLPDGTVIFHVGVHNHGQGHETTLAQIAAHELTIDPDRISVRYGDTATSPYGFGTFASRSIVFAGGAVARASRMLAEKIRRIGAHLLQTDVASTRIEAGAVHGPSGKVGIGEIAFIANVRQEQLPTGMEPLLEAVGTYEPAVSGGVFAYGVHAVVVAVEPDSGVVELLDYVVAEDCGTMINPMIVDGQVRGGIAQGIGTALYEEIPYDELGQPLATTFADYMVPCAPGNSRRAGGAPHVAGDGDRVRGQGSGRRRRHRPSGSDRECRRRRVPQHRCELQRDAAHAAPCLRGDRASASHEGRRCMKPAPFDYVRPNTVSEAGALLAQDGVNSAAIAGGQSLVPMLSLRVAQIDLLVDLKSSGRAEGGQRVLGRCANRRPDHPRRH